jgi:spore maturation protein A
MIGATNSSLSLSFELLAIYSVWLGILGIVENTKLSIGLSKMLSPLIDLLWGKNSMNSQAKKYLSLSLSTSVLGIGGASVPLGIKAVEQMDNKTGIITFPMIMTIVFASSGVQLIPTTVMGMMISSGSSNPAFIILPTILSGIVTTVVGVSLALLLEKISKTKNKRSGQK